MDDVYVPLRVWLFNKFWRLKYFAYGARYLYVLTMCTGYGLDEIQLMRRRRKLSNLQLIL
jgi:hypothetical protein